MIITILNYHKTLFKLVRFLTLIFPRTPLLSKVWATISLNSVSSSADILNFVLFPGLCRVISDSEHMTKFHENTHRVVRSRMRAKFVPHVCVRILVDRHIRYSARDKKNEWSAIMAVQPCQQFSLGNNIDWLNLIPF